MQIDTPDDKPGCSQHHSYMQKTSKFNNSCLLDNKDKKILCIGDNLNTDIKGANLQNFDSLIISDGIHKTEIENSGIEKVSKMYESIPNYIQSKLTW